ncbi:hypothetical protein [Streptomyces niveus]|uniref:hypothetical protein n=1 Tax=Streptomyces niveus TaxID=193462 RepID=UPI00342D54BB
MPIPASHVEALRIAVEGVPVSSRARGDRDNEYTDRLRAMRPGVDVVENLAFVEDGTAKDVVSSAVCGANEPTTPRVDLSATGNG